MLVLYQDIVCLFVGISKFMYVFDRWISELDSQHIRTRKNVNENVTIGVGVFVISPIKVHISHFVRWLCRRIHLKFTCVDYN